MARAAPTSQQALLGARAPPSQVEYHPRCIRRRARLLAGAPFNDSPQELATTIRFSFTRDGHILGQPRFTYVQAGLSANAKQALKQMIGHALITCTPLSFTNGLGGAIAGRPFSIRIFKEPKAPSGVEHELTPGRHP